MKAQRLAVAIVVFCASLKGNALSLAPQTTGHKLFARPDDEDRSPKYVRWYSTSSSNNSSTSLDSYSQLLATPSTVQLQTAITTFQKPNDPNAPTIELHSQVHLADKAYFDFYNTAEFARNQSAILYELLVDEQLLEIATGTSEPWRRRVKTSSAVQASLADRAIATQYGWTCQADVIDYGRLNWYHADLTRQEFVRYAIDDVDAKAYADTDQPLWALAATRTKPTSQSLPRWLPIPSTALEAATALLVGPPIIVQQLQPKRVHRRRIFTNLFLPGDSFATWLRYVLWIAVPSPEISILLLDWSSSWSSISPSSDQSTGRAGSTSNMSRVSRIAVPLLQTLSRGRLDQMRQLVFGQTLLAGHQAAVKVAYERDDDDDDDSLLIAQRNNHALDIVDHEVEWTNQRRTIDNDSGRRIALLFGCNHCPDLDAKLSVKGFQAVETTWRTAWSVPLLQDGRDRNAGNGSVISFVFLTALAAFLLVSGADWIATLQDVGNAANKSDYVASLVIVAWYILRHALLYVGLSKLVLDGESYNRSEG